MARLGKRQLFAVLETAILDGGWRQLRLSPAGQHPARYAVYNAERRMAIRAYIWNLTPGGRNRSPHEWRVQATGIDGFEQETGGKTLILGWEDERQVLVCRFQNDVCSSGRVRRRAGMPAALRGGTSSSSARRGGDRRTCHLPCQFGIEPLVGFDCRKHLGPIGHSPSIQVREDALDRAAVDGFAVHNRGNGELAVAFRPDFLPAYIGSLESLHDCGHAEQEVALLHDIARRAEDVDDADVEATVDQTRRYAVIATKRALRQLDFRGRVLSAYRHSCAMCGIQLQLLDAAHILPAAHPASTDGTDNGVALCVLHHRAFDDSLVTFDAAFRTHVNEASVDALRNANRDGGLQAFREALRPVLGLPADRRTDRRRVSWPRTSRGVGGSSGDRAPVRGRLRRSAASRSRCRTRGFRPWRWSR